MGSKKEGMMKKKDKKLLKEIISWRGEQITLIELMFFAYGFALIGLGMGTITGSMTGRAEGFYVWVGWGITIIPMLLIILRLGVFKKRKKTKQRQDYILGKYGEG